MDATSVCFAICSAWPIANRSKTSRRLLPIDVLVEVRPSALVSVSDTRTCLACPPAAAPANQWSYDAALIENTGRAQSNVSLARRGTKCDRKLTATAIYIT